MSRPVVFITGASAGIGESLAHEFAKNGYDLCLFARREDRLKKIAAEIESTGARTLSIIGDVTDESAMTAAAKKCADHFGKIDTVVANAGFGVAGRLDSLKVEDYRRQFETNVFGLLNTIYATLPFLKKSRGTLALLGSVASYVVLPQASPYGMSKFAVRALAEALFAELKPDGVSVVLVSPGFIESDIRKTSNRGVYRETAKEPIPAYLVMPREKAAKKIFKAIQNRRREIILTKLGKFIVFFKNHFSPLFFFAVKHSSVRGRSEPSQDSLKVK